MPRRTQDFSLNTDTIKEEMPMFVKKILCALIIASAVSFAGLHAGDTASFVDLGFSPDGRIYMFAQYGVQSKTLKPWADLFAVNVPGNNFVSGGRTSYVHDSPVVAGQDGSGALYRIMTRNAALADSHRVNFLFQGQPLYISLENPGSSSNETIEFRDFENGASYKASLVSSIEGAGPSLKSSFYINLERTGRDGSKKTYTVGTPQFKRPQIRSYRIRKVMIAPHDGSMIFVIEMKKLDGADFDIRFMVEALRL
jgi:predicted secreted protein